MLENMNAGRLGNRFSKRLCDGSRGVLKYGCIFITLLTICSVFPGTQSQAGEKIDTRFEKAESLLNTKKFPEASNLYEEILSDDPSNIGGYRGLVKSYQALGDTLGAAAFIETLFLEHPENAAVNYGMGYVQFNLKNYPAAASYFDKALQLNPDLAEAWNNRAAIYQFFEQDYEKARAYYAKAIALSQHSRNSRVLSIARQNSARLPKKKVLKPITETLTLEEFVNRFMTAIEAGDQQKIRRLVLGQKQNCEQAMAWLLDQAVDTSIVGSSDDDNSALLIARLLAKNYQASFNSNYLEGKLEAYYRLSDESKRLLVRSEELIRAGLQAEQNGDYAESLKHYRAAVLSFEKYGDMGKTGLAYVYLGDVYIKQQQYTLARDVFQKALVCFGDSAALENRALVLVSLGKTCFASGEYAAALQYLNQSLAAYRKLNDAASVKKVEQNITIVKQKLE